MELPFQDSVGITRHLFIGKLDAPVRDPAAPHRRLLTTVIGTLRPNTPDAFEHQLIINTIAQLAD